VTYDFFETLAHYSVKLEFRPERLSVVALLRNPLLRTPSEFGETFVRQNETTFRNALLESALADGFPALRLLAAYKAARGILAEREAEAKKSAAVRDQANPKSDQPNPPLDPAAPQAAALLEVLRPIHAAAQLISKNADIDTSLTKIRDHAEKNYERMSEDDRRNAQYWLFAQCLAARMPSLLDGLQKLAGVAKSSDLTVEHAQGLATVLPGPASPRPLSSLSELTESEKEDCGLKNAIHRYMRVFWDWGWWIERCKEELLYTPNDAGIIGLADKLTRAIEAWEAKRAEGAFAKDRDAALDGANEKQGAAMTDDQLAMAFPLDEHSRAVERADALLGHIAAHPLHYSYALFQALTPHEQLSSLLAASGGQLQVGLFEPRVVAMHGERLAVPLTPLAVGGLEAFMKVLRATLTEALDDAAVTPDTIVLPTPGITVGSRMGQCSAAESFVEDSRAIDVELARARLRQAEAEADSAAAEAQRRKLLLKAQDLKPFAPPS
jgi:hypothetical protein